MLTLLREAELALLSDGVALLATVSVEKVLGEFSRAFPQRQSSGPARSTIAQKPAQP